MESISIIENKILMIRGQRVMLDADLAFLYGVPLKRLNEQVQRNITRFPNDFMFQLNKEEYANLKSQFATSSLGHGGKRKLPYVFTEHGNEYLYHSCFYKNERVTRHKQRFGV